MFHTSDTLRSCLGKVKIDKRYRKSEERQTQKDPENVEPECAEEASSMLFLNGGGGETETEEIQTKREKQRETDRRRRRMIAFYLLNLQS